MQLNKIGLLLCAFLILAPAALSSQARLYPRLAQEMKNDGFSGRQNGYLSGIKKESMEQNRQGYAAYEKKDYPRAILLFEKALVLDDTNMFARFNLACTLSLLYGQSGLNGMPYPSKEKLDEAIYQHLVKAADQDGHWIYKAFTDSDLDAVRDNLLAFTIYRPCPGDACPDQYYFLKPNGTAGYAAEYPDLSGMGDRPTPQPAAQGWYTLIGDYVFVFIPGIREVIASKFPSQVPEEGAGAKTGPSLNCFKFKRNETGQIMDVEWLY
jgi:hypothetical protein